jgi:endonuclease/exonuclease/phosphatase family metal-dependent hydrolase
MDGRIDLNRIAAVIARKNPDLVALQEIDKNCARSGNQDIAAELGRLLGMQHRFAKFMEYQGGEYGMAVLSRLPIIDTLRFELPDGAEPRCALAVRVQVESLRSPLLFVGIHNDWTKQSYRLQQVTTLLESLDEQDDPIILAGDFNAERTNESMALLEKAGWKIVEKRDHERNTFPSEKPSVEIDFFVIRNLPEAIINHEVINEKVASDHLPIFAEFLFRDESSVVLSK